MAVCLYFVQIVLIGFIVFQIENDRPFLLFNGLLSCLVGISIINTRSKIPVAVHFGYLEIAVCRIHLVCNRDFFTRNLGRSVDSCIRSCFQIQCCLSFYGYKFFARRNKRTVKEQEGTIVFDLENDKTYQDNLYKIQANGNKIYVRVGANTFWLYPNRGRTARLMSKILFFML